MGEGIRNGDSVLHCSLFCFLLAQLAKATQYKTTT